MTLLELQDILGKEIIALENGRDTGGFEHEDKT